ncbi:hypothetical protein HMF8227_01995 [Saliniradius amylolyticus]|uniref:Uncharacterized protein n=1 Tax=Saliniradius amylolyticus TaxID=2183582 RepID=A0A2S2E490_9ALTE|nr:hypothetical protein [Saliniradius amylolyticus]AWL12465.1 hypothetical protein HMF8227_01995 [Saliniradius amylolyticus]
MKSLNKEDKKSDIKSALIILPLVTLVFGFAMGLIADFGLIRGELPLPHTLKLLLPLALVVAFLLYVIYRYSQKIERL